MMSEKFFEIVSSIKDKTIKGIIKWKRTSNPLEFLSTSMEPYAIGIFKSDDSSTYSPAITFYIMDEYSRDSLRQTKTKADANEYDILRDLYECIDTKDEKTTQFLDDFLRKLNVEKAS